MRKRKGHRNEKKPVGWIHNLHTIETDALGDLGLDIDITSEGNVEAFGLLTEGEHAVRLRAVDTTDKEGNDSVLSPSLAEAYARVERDVPELFDAPLMSPAVVKQETEDAVHRVTSTTPRPCAAGSSATYLV